MPDTDHVPYEGTDGEFDYLARAYHEGQLTISTRPVGGHRWSPEVTLRETAAVGK